MSSRNGLGRRLPVGIAAERGLRPSMEDRHVVEARTPGLLAAVLDGHGGPRAADLAARGLADAFFAALSRRRRPETAFVEAFAELDAAIRFRTCGTTVAACFLQERALTTAHVGDSRILLVASTADRFLTRDHRVDHPGERARVRQLGGQIAGHYVVHGDRGLMVTRALGDRDLRAVGVVAVPEIRTMPVPVGAVAIVAACDGVWDALDAHEAGRLVRVADDAQAAARALVDAALEAGSQDNVSALVVLLPRGSDARSRPSTRKG